MITYENKPFYTIFEINDYIKTLFDNTLTLNNVGLIGEVSNFRGANRSGHLYFSLKDEKSIISCVLFKYDAMKLNFSFKDGDMILVIGNISSYIANGTYQLIIKKVIPYGEGNILLKREQLKEKLYKEGLFDISKKKQIPYFPKKISIICGENSAAERDFSFNIKRRNPLVEVNFIYSKVQGNEAIDDLLNALNKASNDDSDLIILGRGGGAKEDLMVFDEEQLVRKVASLNKPIISAIGHEINLSLVDLASDVHVSTPTAACERAVVNIEDIIKELYFIKSNIYKSLINKIDNYEKKIMELKNIPALKSYSSYLFEIEKQLGNLSSLINSSINKIIDINNNKINNLKLRLSILDINNLLNKGYSLVYKGNKLIKDISSLSLDDEIIIKTGNGKIVARIIDLKKE